MVLSSSLVCGSRSGDGGAGGAGKDVRAWLIPGGGFVPGEVLSTSEDRRYRQRVL
jgi:hypothetical protein